MRCSWFFHASNKCNVLCTFCIFNSFNGGPVQSLHFFKCHNFKIRKDSCGNHTSYFIILQKHLKTLQHFSRFFLINCLEGIAFWGYNSLSASHKYYPLLSELEGPFLCLQEYATRPYFMFGSYIFSFKEISLHMFEECIFCFKFSIIRQVLLLQYIKAKEKVMLMCEESCKRTKILPTPLPL